VSRLASLVVVRARRALRFATCAAICAALPACLGVSSDSAAVTHARCGRSSISGGYGGANVDAAGAWYGGAGPVAGGAYAYGAWYDPGDGYDPATNSGGITTDPNSDDGSGWDQTGDGTQGDPGSDPGAGNGDTSSGDPSSGDPSVQALTRLHLHGVDATPTVPVSAPPRSDSPSSSSTPLPLTPATLPDGCFRCMVGCRTDAPSAPFGREANGVSDTSYEDACGSAVRTLAQWSHDTRREKLVLCQRIETR
jgi:hypothetical protein